MSPRPPPSRDQDACIVNLPQVGCQPQSYRDLGCANSWGGGRARGIRHFEARELDLTFPDGVTLALAGEAKEAFGVTAFTDRWACPCRRKAPRRLHCSIRQWRTWQRWRANGGRDACGARRGRPAPSRPHLQRLSLPLRQHVGGRAAARKVLDDLERFDGGTDEREVLHLRAASGLGQRRMGERHGHSNGRCSTIRGPSRPQGRQDLYFFLGNRLDLRDVAARVLPAWPSTCRGGAISQGSMRSGSRRTPTTGQAEARARDALIDNPLDVWRSTRSLTSSRWRAGSTKAWRSSPRPHRTGRRATSPCTTGGHRCLYHLDLLEFDEVLDLYDAPSAPSGPTSGSTSSTPPHCSGGCRCSGSM